jgi:fibronectin type 3 domain-containing protein
MIHRRVIIRCLFVILPAAAIAAAASSGFYAGTTSEGRGIGIHVNSNVQDSLRVRYRLYRCGGSYVKDTTIDEGRSAAIALDTFTNEIVSDTTTLGGGTPIWTLTGRFNYQTMKARTVYVNTTGTFDWTNNRLSGDSRCRASADGVTYSVRYLGTTAPGAGPSSVSAECLSSSSIRIGWNTTPGALRYAVYQSTTAEGPYGLCAYASSTSYTRSSLASNQTYYYKIRAENIWGWTDYSSSASATTAPATPSGVTATTLSDSTIRVGWDGVSGASSYSVSRSEASDGPYALVGTSATASYTDSLLSPATTYYYTITALNDEGSASVPSSYASATTAPEAPTEFTATPLSSSTVELRWSASTGATYYYIYRSTNSSSGFTYIGYTSTPSYTSGSLAAGTTYFYRIRAYRTTYSAYSEPVPALTFPAAPSGIAAFDTPSDAVEITWSPSTGATWHAVARSSSVSGPFVPLDTVKSPPLIDTLIAPGEVRYYTVAAGNASGWSSYGSPAACGVTPDAPGSLSATALSSSSILVSWSSVEGASSYRVYQSDSAETVGSSLATLASTSHTASGLSANTTYFFHVVASSPAGPSPFSDSATATTPPRAPTTVTVSPLSSSSVRITWDATAGASSYAVHRAVTTSGPFTAVATVSSLDHTDESLDDTTTYYYAVTAFGSGGESDRSTVVPGTTLAQPVLTVGKTSLTAAAREGGNPAGGSFEIGNDGTGTMDYTVTWKAPWLSVSPGSGECTDEQDVLSVSYNASTLTPGSFRDTITVEATGAEQSPREVTVTLTISEAPLPLISLNVDTLAITVRKSSSPPPSRVTVYNSGTGVLRYSVAADQPWLSVTPRSGTSSGEHDTLSVGYTVTALDTGSHFGRVVVSDVNGVAAPDTTVVALRVEPVPAPNVALSPTTIDITVTEGNVAATRKAFVRNGGDTILDYSVTSDSPWCTATPASGQSAGEMDTITLTCTAESLPPGSYTAHVVAANAAFIAESETLTVNLTVTARPVPIAVAEPARIERSTVGGSSPDSSLLRIRNAGPGTLAWRVAVEGDWLSTAPTSGSVTVGTDTMVVRYDAARLGVGTHTGRVILSDAIEHMEPETVTVILVVDPRPAPVIALAPNGFVKTAIHGEQLGVDTMWLRNEGTDTLRYRVTPTADWVLPSRTSGISTGAVDTVILAYDVSSLPAGEHYALVIVTDDTDGSVKAETLTVALSIDAATPPHIVVEPQALSRRLHPGDSTTAAITVRNGGGATVSYRLRSTRTWISVD